MNKRETRCHLGKAGLQPAGYLGNNPKQVMQIDNIAGFEVLRHGFRTYSGEADLTVRLFRIDHIDVQGDLAMNAHWLYLLDNSWLGTLQHVFGVHPDCRPEPSIMADAQAPGLGYRPI